ncbi:MAG: hypothetical protein KF819_05955 [Labilithrix sp.]|nr:hypothetical protein [Labilithrix sp.]
MNALLRCSIVASAGLFLALQASCARSDSAGEDPGPALENATPAPLSACVDTACPPPWASCRGAGLCATDTSRDIDNCGACGNGCPVPSAALHATSLCSGGKCVYACKAFSADCNLLAYDGCEVDTGSDPANCGGCGLACEAGEICWRGACGCPAGFTRCGTECKNTSSDNESCGGCNATCVAPPYADPAWTCGPGVQPANTTWGCAGGGCALTCAEHFSNCNGDLCADGCEADERTDPLNCGGCGRACEANQECVNGQCLCPPGTTRCFNSCVDLSVDPSNCGACGNGCPGAADGNGTPTCNGGTCGYLCYKGFADCNGRASDGCEVEINKDPRNCGGCGTQCDLARGQPCVGGRCLTKPCTPEEAPR